MNPDERPSKRDAFLAFLGEGGVFLHLDARRGGVVVPPTFRGEPHLVLQYARNMPIPIPDLEITEDGISATLSFARQPHQTFVPWSAVYVVACADSRGILYEEDVPPDVKLTPAPSAPPDSDAAEATAGGDGDAPAGAAPSSAPAARHLQSVPAEADPEDDAASDDQGAAQRRRRRPTLRLVK